MIRRSSSADWQFWCQGDPKRNGNQLSWQNGTTWHPGRAGVPMVAARIRDYSICRKRFIATQRSCMRTFPLAILSPDSLGYRRGNQIAPSH